MFHFFSKSELDDLVATDRKFRPGPNSPTRLAQEIEDELLVNDMFLEGNLLVVKMEKAIAFLAKTGKYQNMVRVKDI